jgi:hypothetical protein
MTELSEKFHVSYGPRVNRRVLPEFILNYTKSDHVPLQHQSFISSYQLLQAYYLS